ncbi:MAG: DMT family transporter [Pseudonocardia sp.]|nr:DMT family transporter [Pseudonocardia sp.]
MTDIAAGLALLAAVLFAVGTVAQQRSAATVPDDTARGLGLIRVLMHRRQWWLGVIGDGGGYVAQAAALAFGSLLLVQPLLVTTLLFALPLGARWAGRTLGRADWVWAAVLAVALAVFVVTGEPTDGLSSADFGTWLPTMIVLGALLGAGLVAVSRSRGTVRAALLAGCAALCFGVAAAMTKGVVGEFDAGLVAVLTSWETYALIVVAVAGTLLQQSAFQAGALGASLPTMIVGEPIVAVAIGVTVLEEELRSDGAELALIGLLGIVMVVATVALARSSARSTPPVSPVGVHDG